MSRGLLANILHSVRVKCAEAELVSFEPPAGSSCNEYAGEWLATARGYIVDGNATDTCQYCPFKSGDEYLDSLNIQ
jgi:ATP-binding cassette subfamily G (WHITE) protein 2 (SNQ2)